MRISIAKSEIKSSKCLQNLPEQGKGAGRKVANWKSAEGRPRIFLSKFHIELKGQVFDTNQWNLWTFASLGIFSLHVPCTSMAWKSVALPYDFQMRYRSTGHLTTYDIFRYFYTEITGFQIACAHATSEVVRRALACNSSRELSISFLLARKYTSTI